MTDRFRNTYPNPGEGRGLTDGDVVEVPLLLPGWQVAALETAAHDCGLTAAEMVRRLVREFIVKLSPRRPEAFCSSKEPVQVG
jgi:hypothetical protein